MTDTIPWQPIDTVGDHDALLYFPLEDYGFMPNPAVMYQIAQKRQLRTLQPTAWARLHTPFEEVPADHRLPWQPIAAFGNPDRWGLFFIPRDQGMPELIWVRKLSDIVHRRATHFVRLHRPGVAP